MDTLTIEQGGGGPTTWTYAYDAVQQLTEVIRHDASETLLDWERYSYNRAGDRTQVVTGTVTPVGRNYRVNSRNQLVSEHGFGPTTFAGTVDDPALVTANGQPAKVISTDGEAPYRFEAVVDLEVGSNLVSIEAVDGNDNSTLQRYEVTTTGTTTLYEYDADGNLRFEREPNGSVRREFRWDQQNRLVRIIEGTHGSVFQYDGALRRVRIQEIENSVETANLVFVWCDDRICQKRNGSGSTLVRNYFDEGFLDGSTHHFSAKDRLGSVRDVIANDGETIERTYSYDSCGAGQSSGTGSESDFGCTGHFVHGPSGINLAQDTRLKSVAGSIGIRSLKMVVSTSTRTGSGRASLPCR